MKTTNLRFGLLLVLSTLMGCALGHARSSPPSSAPSQGRAGAPLEVASARHVVSFTE